MANKIPDLYMISRMETQCKGKKSEAPAKIFPLLFVPAAVPPGRGVCSAAREPYLLPAGTWRACSDTGTRAALPLFPQTHF